MLQVADMRWLFSRSLNFFRKKCRKHQRGLSSHYPLKIYAFQSILHQLDKLNTVHFRCVDTRQSACSRHSGCMHAIYPNKIMFDSGADEQFVQGLLALKMLPLDWFVEAMLKEGAIAVNSLSDIRLICQPSDDDVIRARSYFAEAVRLAFEVLERINKGLLPGVVDADIAESSIRADLRQYVFHLAQAFHCPWALPGRQKAARPDVAKYLYEFLSHMGDYDAYRYISYMYSKGHFGGKYDMDSRKSAAYWMRKAHGGDPCSQRANFGESWAWKAKYTNETPQKHCKLLDSFKDIFRSFVC